MAKKIKRIDLSKSKCTATQMIDRNNVFSIIVGEKVYHFSAESEQEKEKWMNVSILNGAMLCYYK